MAFEWKKTGKEITSAGTTITYSAEGCGWIIESRKRHIPHSGRSGTWDHTTFAVILPGNPPLLIWEAQTMKDAKEYIEKQEIKPLSEFYREEKR